MARSSPRISPVLAAGGLLFGLCVCAPAVRADVAAAFADKVTVDTGFVTGASTVTDIAFHVDGRAVVTRKTGQVHVRRPDGNVTVLAYPFPGTLDTESEKGLLGVVADPDVATNHRFYFYVSNGTTDTDKHRVYRATLTAADTLTVDPDPIVGASRGVGPGLEGPANHDGGGMVIHAGQLYLGVGDTGANASPPVNKFGSCLNRGNGKILRVNLDGSVPADNPLVGLATVSGCATPTGPWVDDATPDPRIYSWGFRNPWRLWVDPQSGRLWVGDVGETSEEEISIGSGNQHYGYPFVEGNRNWGNVDGRHCNLASPPGALVPTRACTPPAFTYPRTEGRAVTGGLILDGPAWEAVFGSPHYVFGDSSTHWVRVLPVNTARTGFAAAQMIDFATYASARPVSFRTGPDGALYVVYLGLGAVYRFAPSVPPCTDCAVQVPLFPWPFVLAGAGLLAVIGVRHRGT
ncbi:MAG: sorbosone dehydrogenase family protein [Gammaproteobacteria bacterium]